MSCEAAIRAAVVAISDGVGGNVPVLTRDSTLPGPPYITVDRVERATEEYGVGLWDVFEVELASPPARARAQFDAVSAALSAAPVLLTSATTGRVDALDSDVEQQGIPRVLSLFTVECP